MNLNWTKTARSNSIPSNILQNTEGNIQQLDQLVKGALSGDRREESQRCNHRQPCKPYFNDRKDKLNYCTNEIKWNVETVQ